MTTARNELVSLADRKQIVLAALREQGTFSAAAEATGFVRQSIYNWRQDDPEFAEACKQAVLEGIDHMGDRLESTLFSRALDDERRDTTALIFALKGTRPQRWQQSVRIEQVESQVEQIAARFGVTSQELLEEMGRLAGGQMRQVTEPSPEPERT